MIEKVQPISGLICGRGEGSGGRGRGLRPITKNNAQAIHGLMDITVCGFS